MSRRVAKLPAATLGAGDVVLRAGRRATVVHVTAGVGLFDGLLELHTDGPYIRPWPVEVDQPVPAVVDEDDARLEHAG